MVEPFDGGGDGSVFDTLGWPPDRAATLLLVMIQPVHWWLDHGRLAVAETAANLPFRPDDGRHSQSLRA